ncbi:hypothetical protein C8J56DRAFT_890190 [Mycena floridula]|nr:hypothetical protein C8J56DRAFT_890190 [Mycena floridula]
MSESLTPPGLSLPMCLATLSGATATGEAVDHVALARYITGHPNSAGGGDGGQWDTAGLDELESPLFFRHGYTIGRWLFTVAVSNSLRLGHPLRARRSSTPMSTVKQLLGVLEVEWTAY